MKAFCWIAVVCSAWHACTAAVNLPNGDVRDVLRAEAAQNHFSVIIPGSLTGKVSVVLSGEDWQAVYIAILHPLGYAFHKVGDLVVVEKEAGDVEQVDAPTVDPASLKALQIPGVNVQSVAGTIVLTGRGEDVHKAREAVVFLARRQPSVRVECRFLETDVTDGANTGLNWSSLSGVPVTLESVSRQLSSGATGAAAWSGSLAIGAVGPVVQAFLSAGKTTILAAPTLVAVSGQKANVVLGEQYPIPQYSFSAQQAVVQVSGIQYKDIGITLAVQPVVTDGIIYLTLKPEVSSVGGTVAFAGVGGAVVPTINTRSVETTASLKDGETLVIGGLRYKTSQDDKESVPGVAKVPIIGKLFKGRQRSSTEQELTVLVTVHVLK